MSHQMNTPFDTDLDAFLNYDQGEQTTMSSASDVKPVPALLRQNSFASSSDAYSGPSYQYDSHRQQTGLPMGGYANTLAINQASGLHYRPNNYGFVMPTETLNIPLSNLSDFDFNQPQQYEFADMDVEKDSPAEVPSMFPNGESSVSPATHIPPRIYPGMHTAQAKQQEMIKQQQQHPQRLPAGQRPLPTNAPAPKSPAVKDPVVEESISRLLSRMRQTSNASAEDDADDDSQSGSMPRIKKDEDDMDDDERLLNSEEGKKLSSKERRQLRNKVSARAFRSRRKEYITQLEAELAGKAQDANELRIQNRQLLEENTRLTDLTRMLLSSQAFSGFLTELSQTGGVPAKIPQQASRQQQQVPSQSQPQQSRKDLSSHEAARQVQSQNQHMQVGMTLIPETPIDMSIFDNHTPWNNVLSSTEFQVYSVAELPEPPKIDMAAMSGKSEITSRDFNTSILSKKMAPTISSTSNWTISKPAPLPTPQSDDLYSDDEVPSVITTITLPTTLYTTLSKAAVSAEILSAQSTTITGSWSELENLCQELDKSCDKLAELMY